VSLTERPSLTAELTVFFFFVSFFSLGEDEAKKFSLNGEKFVGHYDPEEQKRLREEMRQARSAFRGDRRWSDEIIKEKKS
jgi:hypothetical protein